MNIHELVTELVNKHGQGTLADMIQVDHAAMSRWRSGQGAINISAVEKLFEIAGVEIVTRSEIDGFEKTISFIADLWNRERTKRKEKRES